MLMNKQEKREWSLLAVIALIGIALMLVAGQAAIYRSPEWNVSAKMHSNLDSNRPLVQNNSVIQLLLPAILTPPGWFDTFLTPGASLGFDFPPIVIFEPTNTPEIVPTQPIVVTQVSPTIVPPTVTATPTIIVTNPPNGSRTPLPPTATNTPVPTVTTATVEPTATEPTVTPTETVVVTETVTPTETVIPTATEVGTISTPPPFYSAVNPPINLGVNVPPDESIAGIRPGTYTVVDTSTNPVHVSNVPDIFYDITFYEYEFRPGIILLDRIIVGISQVDDGSYYEVFNWGDNIPDENTNVDLDTLPVITCSTECDNRVVPTDELYTDPVSNVDTGILIDVDNAPSNPPEGDYGYIVIVSPLSGVPDSAQIDSIVVEEVPITP
jgi:hypothetical protein